MSSDAPEAGRSSILLFDIGGTRTRIAHATNGVLSEVIIESTPQDALSAVARLERYVHEQGIVGAHISGGVAGIVRDGVIVDSPNLLSWNGAPLRDMLAHAFGVPVHVENDAACEAIGEATQGAGKGYGLVGFLTIGTGVGGALISNGALALHHDGFEPGRMILDSRSGKTLEGFVGGAALARETGRDTKQLSSSFYDDRARMLAIGIANLIEMWSPDVFVLGGSLMNDVSGFRISVLEEYLTVLMPNRALPPVLPATLGNEAGLRGALACAQ